MDRTDILLLIAAVGVAAAAVIYWRRTSAAAANRPTAPGGITLLTSTADLPVGTNTSDGRYWVNQTKSGGKFWAAAPNPFLTPEAVALSQSLFPPPSGAIEGGFLG